jgi:glutathione S-transferase
MPEFTFFTNPMSRGQISRWALHEADADYQAIEFSNWEERPKSLAEHNPMNKVPTLVHHLDGEDHVICEAAAINHYLAETHPEKPLLPRPEEKAAYFRWLFFAAGPLEQAIIAKAMGWEVAEGKQGMAGFGSLELTLNALEDWFKAHDFVCGARFTMADTYVGSQFIWGLRFGSVENRPAFRAYVERCTAREAYQAALKIDEAAIKAAAGKAAAGKAAAGK